ncbi:MAG: hypothetical protein GY943_29320 [Chloroflexi bacterium]|nr:hypothetical protein [Chloroflexota bacterium]
MSSNKYTIVLTVYEYSILNENYLISTMCQKQLELTTTYEQGGEEVIELSMTLDELEDLTGYVAAESNHARTARQGEELGAICDDFEARISEIKRRK